MWTNHQPITLRRPSPHDHRQTHPTPQDEFLAELAHPDPSRPWSLLSITIEYPWPSPEHRDQYIDLLNNAQVSDSQRSTLHNRIEAIVNERQQAYWQARTQEGNNILDTVLAVLTPNQHTPDFSADTIFADAKSIAAGVTIQHWANALRTWAQPDFSRYSDGHTVNYWYHSPLIAPRFIIHIKHVDEWNDDKPHYIRLDAHRTSEFQNEQEPGPVIGSAVLIWPWV